MYSASGAGSGYSRAYNGLCFDVRKVKVNMNDIEYTDQGLFTAFVPVSKAGEVAFNQMAEYTEGTGKVLSIHKQGTIQQLRQAGYKVGKAKQQGKITAEQADDMLRELGIE